MNKKRYVSIPCYYRKWKVFMSIWYVSTTNMSQYHLLSVGLRRKRRIGSGKMWTGNLHLIHTLIFVTYVFSLSLIRFLMINAYMLLTFTGPFRSKTYVLFTFSVAKEWLITQNATTYLITMNQIHFVIFIKQILR